MRARMWFETFALRVLNSAVVTGSSLWEWSDTLVHLRRKRREQETLSAVIEESRQKSEELRLRKEERQQEAERTRGLSRSQDILPKDRETSRAVLKAEKQKRELTNMEAELQKLQEEQSSLERRIEQQLQQVQRCSLFHDFMQRVVQATKFENVQAITDSLENLLRTRDQFSERFSRADEQVNRQRKALLTHEDQHRLTVLGRSNQLLQLQTELERTFSEAEFWEREWSHIQETAANETLLLGQIKMATLNLHELTNGEAENAGAEATYDTELLLEKISVFVQDHNDIVKWGTTFT
ncbi:coiled-coil domain-containing protein 42 like-2-like isoform X2 [Synchiropus splendidus]|uniref:coiled-coil domain-containing protein 42 like-2-like isoform X2 n=1 Tax=Synchiropus splendidus TaxID=270530 RepID=UPI00237D4F98|nr:coiled-coil domain-containing protein 42 like-2-like isoform X2 [Synchiropus splendidus]